MYLLFCFLNQPAQLLFKDGNVVHTGAIHILLAKRLRLLGGDVAHSRYGAPRNLSVRVLQFGGQILHQLADVDERHADGSNRAFIAEEVLWRNAVEQVPDDDDFVKYPFAYLSIPTIHSTRTTFPGCIMLSAGSGA